MTFMDIFSWVGLGMLPFNMVWMISTKNMRRSVPGSLAEEYYKGKCRIYRYPGFAFWPLLTINQAIILADPAGPLWIKPLFVLVTLWCLKSGRDEWRELRRQIEEDDDDPWNKGKRALKKLGAAVKQAATIRVPQPAALGV